MMAFSVPIRDFGLEKFGKSVHCFLIEEKRDT